MQGHVEPWSIARLPACLQYQGISAVPPLEQKGSTMPIYIADKAATEYVTIDGDSIAYRRFGNGDPLLLTNRLRGTLDTWDPLFLG